MARCALISPARNVQRIRVRYHASATAGAPPVAILDEGPARQYVHLDLPERDHCMCCNTRDVETVQHFLLQCPFFDPQRAAFVTAVRDAAVAAALHDMCNGVLAGPVNTNMLFWLRVILAGPLDDWAPRGFDLIVPPGVQKALLPGYAAGMAARRAANRYLTQVCGIRDMIGPSWHKRYQRNIWPGQNVLERRQALHAAMADKLRKLRVDATDTQTRHACALIVAAESVATVGDASVTRQQREVRAIALLKYVRQCRVDLTRRYHRASNEQKADINLWIQAFVHACQTDWQHRRHLLPGLDYGARRLLTDLGTVGTEPQPGTGHITDSESSSDDHSSDSSSDDSDDSDNDSS